MRVQGTPHSHSLRTALASNRQTHGCSLPFPSKPSLGERQWLSHCSGLAPVWFKGTEAVAKAPINSVRVRQLVIHPELPFPISPRHRKIAGQITYAGFPGHCLAGRVPAKGKRPLELPST